MGAERECFYTEFGNLIDINDLMKKGATFLSSGNCGSAYLFNDCVIKLVDSDGDMEQYDTVSCIKNLSLPNFYKLYSVLSCERNGIKTFGGTISKYYLSENVDMFLKPSDYLLDSFNSLYKSMSELGKNNIFVFDLNRANTIVNNDGIFVIDVDLYQRMSYNLPKNIISKNLFKMKCSIFYELLQSNFLNHHGNELKDLSGEDISRMIYDLLNLNDFDDSKTFNKTLSKYKYPIDYIRRRK